jgi:hypothetical protein
VLIPPKPSRTITGKPQEYPIVVGAPPPAKMMVPGPHVKNLELGWAFEDAGYVGVPSRYGSYQGATWHYPAYPSTRVMEDDETLFLCVELGNVTGFGRTRRP